jgi:phytoene dehydrogenase-like protein
MYDAIVVGAGISGLLSALALGKHGKNVLVLEKSGHVGGNCNSYCVDGFWVDTGPHAITHLHKGPLRMLMDEYFDYIPAFVDYGTYYIRTPAGIRSIPSNLREFVTFDVLPRKDRLMLSQALTKALTLSTFGIDTSKMSIYSCMPRHLSKTTYDFVDTIAYFLSGKSMKDTSVYRVLYGSSFVRDSAMYETADQPITDQLAEQITNITGIRRLITNKTAHAQAYPRGGLKVLLNSVLHSLPDNVEIRTNTCVDRILSEDGVVCGVSTDDESYDAEIVIHSGFAKDLPALLEDLPPGYLQDLGRIDQALSMCIWLGLSQQMKEFDYTGSEIWFQEKAYWAMPISNYSSTIAPKGKQLVGFMFVVEDSVKREKERAWETLHRAFPDIEKYIEMTHYQVTTPEKAAVSINGYIPDVRTPLKNLYLVGTDAAAESMGITRAAYSVLDLIKCLKEDGYMRSGRP